MTLALRAATAIVRAHGGRVVFPTAAPRPHTMWHPTRGRSKPRLVRWVDEGNVGYGPDGAPRVCTVGAWRRWRQRARAVVGRVVHGQANA